MALLLANNVATTLASPALSTDSTISVVSATGMPSPSSPDYFFLTLATATSPETAWEVVKVTGVSGTTLTVTRAQDGTTAQGWSFGARAEIRGNAQALRETGLYGGQMYVDVRQFGADPTGNTDSTSAFNAAIAYAASTGIGRVFCGGNGVKYSMNVVLNTSNITIIGSSHCGTRATTSVPLLKPWNIALPVLQVGNGTAHVYGTVLQDLYFYGSCVQGGYGGVGLWVSDGAQSLTTYNLSIKQFLDMAMKVGPTTTSYPIQYNHYYATDLSCHTVSASNAVLGMYYGSTGWTTAQYFHGLNISSDPLCTYAMVLDGVDVTVLGGWIQASTAKGLKLLKTNGSTNPTLRGDCDFEISGAGEGIRGFDTTTWGNFIKGQIRFSSGTTLVDSGSVSHNLNSGFRGSAEMYSPHFLDAAYLNQTTATDTTLTSCGLATSSGVLTIFNNGTTANRLQFETSGWFAHYGYGAKTLEIAPNNGAVNYVQVSNNTTGNWPSIGATGSDTDVSLTLYGKGLGKTRVKNSLSLYTAGGGLMVTEGSNCKQGTATLTAGSVVVGNTSVTANSRIFLTSNTDGGTPGWLRVSARTAGTSFTITSSSGTDTSTVAYEIFEPGV